MTHVDRRVFFRDSIKLAGGAALAPSLLGLAACNTPTDVAAGGPMPELRRAGRGGGGYGPLVPANDGLPYLIPEGFTLTLLSRAGQPMKRPGAGVVPNAFDGMAAFPLPNGNVRLIRNHEIRDGAALSSPIGLKPWDATAPAGCTSLEVVMAGAGGRPELVDEFVSISGTAVNCAGGPTPWGSWLTCEETVEGPNQGRARKHGYVFEIPASAMEEVDGASLNAMGRFSHEAIAVDMSYGHIYETEDAGNTSGFYRFIPNQPGNLLAGGKLQMLVATGRPQLNTTGAVVSGVAPASISPFVPLPVQWVDIDDADPNLEAGQASVFAQGFAKGGARFARLEGCWWGDHSVFFHATSGGRAGAGQVWQYRPLTADRGQLVLIFESPSRGVLDAPDNLCVSPRGGIVICEDGAGEQFIRGLTQDGRIFDVVTTNDPVDDTEFAGACYSPDGGTLFFNQMGSTASRGAEKGGTYALKGPWESGAL